MYDFVKDPLGLFKDDPEFQQRVRSPPAPRRPRTLATDYLYEALEAVRDSGSSAALYDAAIRRAAPNAREHAWTLLASRSAALRRIRFSRTAMMVAAFAAEAYINEFIAQHFDGQDLATIDRLPTVEKYVMAPRLALGRDVFERGREPLQSLRTLFRTRDVLVHPKPERGVPDELSASGYPRAFDADPLFNPREAAAAVLAVALAATTAIREGELGTGEDAHVARVIAGRREILAYAREATERLPLPKDPPRDLPLVGSVPLV